MSSELFWLVLTVAMTGLFWVPYILDRMMVRGLMGAMANPSPSEKAQSPWAQRMMAAHTNAVENLVIFAPLVLTARALSIATAATAFACALYFWSRLAHIVVYTLGIPVLRTLSFVGGFVGAGTVGARDLQTDLNVAAAFRVALSFKEITRPVRGRWFPASRA
jgi:uncharacterized MAPEG superfamily protein